MHQGQVSHFQHQIVLMKKLTLSTKSHVTTTINNTSVGLNVSIQNRVRELTSITIAQENDPANLRLFEALYIRKDKPSLNRPRGIQQIRGPFVLMAILVHLERLFVL